jgi:hypothetical protein
MLEHFLQNLCERYVGGKDKVKKRNNTHKKLKHF